MATKNFNRKMIMLITLSSVLVSSSKKIMLTNVKIVNNGKQK